MKRLEAVVQSAARFCKSVSFFLLHRMLAGRGPRPVSRVHCFAPPKQPASSGLL
jgi:hypothetical protein